MTEKTFPKVATGKEVGGQWETGRKGVSGSIPFKYCGSKRQICRLLGAVPLITFRSCPGDANVQPVLRTTDAAERKHSMVIYFLG